MKKFFKALALMLALTLVIGSVPASAATKISPDEKKTLYVGGCTGTDAAGVKSTYKKKASYANLLNISKQEVIDLKIKAVSSNTDAVKCYNKKAKKYIRAWGIGEATITLTDKNGNTYTVPVNAKKNATSETIMFGQDFKKSNVPDGTLEAEVGQEFTVTIPYKKDKDGKKLDTDLRRIKVVDEKDEDVTESVATLVEGKKKTWTVKFPAAGKYTVYAEAFQSKTQNPGTTASAKVEVTVKGLDFFAEGTKVKEITVTGNGFTKDTAFTVTRGQSTSVKIAKTDIKDDSTAILTLETKIVKDKYTVAQTGTDNKYEFQGEEHTVKEIIIVEDGKTIFTNKSVNGSAKNKAYAHFRVIDNYGQDAHKDFNLTWTTTADTKTVDVTSDTMGLITLGKSTGSFDMNTPIVLVGVYNKTGVAGKGTMTIGLPVGVDSINILGVYDLDAKKTLEGGKDAKIPANFKKNQFAVYFELLDQNGNILKYDAAYKDDLTITSLSPLLATVNDTKMEKITINDIDYACFKLVPANNTRDGGQAVISVISTATGTKGNPEFTIEAAQKLAKFDITGAKSTVAEMEKVELTFDAADAAGNALTKFRDIAPYVSLPDNLYIEETSDGGCKLMYDVPDVGATENSDVPQVLTVMVDDTAYMNPYTIDVRDAKRAVKVKAVKNLPAGYTVGSVVDIIEGNWQTTNDKASTWKYNAWNGEYTASWEGKIYAEFYDQYGETITRLNTYKKDSNGNYTVRVNEVEVAMDSDTLIRLDSAGNETSTIKSVNNLFIAKSEALNSDLVAKREVFLKYNDGSTWRAISDSSYKYVFKAFNIRKGGANDPVTYKLVNKSSSELMDAKAKTYFDVAAADYGKYRATFKVTATFGTGSDAVTFDVPEQYVAYYINAATYASINVAKTAFTNGTGDDNTDSRVNNIDLIGNASVDGKNSVMGSVGLNPFNDYSGTNSNGNWKDAAVDLQFVAEISNYDWTNSVVSGSAVVSGVAVKVKTWAKGIAVDKVTRKNNLDGQIVSVDLEKGTGVVRANNGEIPYSALQSVFGRKIDNYGLATEDVTPVITISDIVEKLDGLHSEATDGKKFTVELNGTSDANLKIKNAEIGDTFVAKFETVWGKTATITFTVENDKSAVRTKTSNPSFY